MIDRRTRTGRPQQLSQGGAGSRARPTVVRTGIRPRASSSTAISAAAAQVLARLRGATGPVTCADLATATGLTVAQTRRALADLRELRLASMERMHGRNAGNAWTAT